MESVNRFKVQPPMIHHHLQGPVVYQGDKRGLAFPGEPGAGLHPEQDLVLPDEHQRALSLHLPVPPWRE